MGVVPISPLEPGIATGRLFYVRALRMMMNRNLLAISILVHFAITGGLAHAQTTTDRTNVTVESILPKIGAPPPRKLTKPLQEIYSQFQPPPDRLLMVSPDWCVWLLQDNIPGQERMRAPVYRFRYLIQRWAGEDAICLADFIDTRAPRQLTGVSARGSLLFENVFGNAPSFWILRSHYESEESPVFSGDIHNFSQYTIVYYTFKAIKEPTNAAMNEIHFELWAKGPFGKGMNGGPALKLATLTAPANIRLPSPQPTTDFEPFGGLPNGERRDWLTLRNIFPILFREGSLFLQIWDGKRWLTIAQPYPKVTNTDTNAQPTAAASPPVDR